MKGKDELFPVVSSAIQSIMFWGHPEKFNSHKVCNIQSYSTKHPKVPLGQPWSFNISEASLRPWSRDFQDSLDKTGATVFTHIYRKF